MPARTNNANRRSGEIFSMSFLDVICCGFAAMVLLVLLSKTDIGGDAPAAEAATLDQNAETRAELAALQQRQSAMLSESERLRDARRKLEEEIRALPSHDLDAETLQQQLAQSRARETILQIKIDSVQTPAPTPVVEAPPAESEDKTTESIVKVGGIPVDSEHIIFIVDTSGSMKSKWRRVLAELENVIAIHPQVKGFQVMNDNGVYLVKAYAGKWIPDTPSRRKSVLAVMKHWGSISNSSPVEGLQRALRTYAKRTDNLAIYIFGDDYSGASYDLVLDEVERLNRDAKSGEPIARIHGVGFQDTGHVADRFATLMRELARQNRGAFIGLGTGVRGVIVEAEHVNRN